MPLSQLGTSPPGVPFPRNRSQSLIRVLIVDDDADFLDLVTDEVSQIPGVSVDLAHDPVEALQKLTHNQYHLIVTDWALDKSTASEVLCAADRFIERGRIPVLFMSGSEKVSQTQVLRGLKHFEPVSFIVKACGPPLIGLLAEHLLEHFHPIGGVQ